MNPTYTEHHPRWLRTRTSTWWWLQRGSYLAFILRELSSVFVAWFIVFLLMLVVAVSEGATRYQAFLAWSGHPIVLALNVLTFGFVVFHAITWFNLAPQALVVRVRGRRVPAGLIAASNYLAWVIASAVVAVLVLGA